MQHMHCIILLVGFVCLVTAQTEQQNENAMAEAEGRRLVKLLDANKNNNIDSMEFNLLTDIPLPDLQRQLELNNIRMDRWKKFYDTNNDQIWTSNEVGKAFLNIDVDGNGFVDEKEAIDHMRSA